MLGPPRDVEVLLGTLHAAYAGLRGPSSGPPVAPQAAYLRALLELESFALRLSSRAAAACMTEKSAAERIVAVSLDHAALGLLPWATMLVWQRVLRAVLQVVHREHHSLAHVSLNLWDKVRRMGKDHYQRTYPAPAVCATLHIFRLLLAYAPFEIRDALRKDLPHPVKNASLPVRVAGYQLAPLVIANSSQLATTSGGSTGTTVARAAPPLLSGDMYEYFRKGLVSSEYGVREAAVEAVRATLALGVLVDSYTAPLLLAQLLAAAQDAQLTSARLEASAGAAIGLLLVLLQTGQIAGKSYEVTSPSEGTWAYFGSSTAPEAARVIRCLFSPDMSRLRQRVLAWAVATLLHHCCPTPASLTAPLRALFVLLVPVEGDNRAYMPRIIADALTQYAQQQPTNSHRVGILVELGNYVRRVKEDRAIVHTALLAVDGVVSLLASARLASASVETDIMAALAAQPGPLMGVVSSIAGRLALHGPFYQHHLLTVLVESSQRMVGNDAAGVAALPSDLLFALKTILAASTHYTTSSAHSSSNGGSKGKSNSESDSSNMEDDEMPFLQIAFADHLLSFVVHIAAAGPPDEGALSTQEQVRADEVRDQRMEYFFLISTLLLTRFPRCVSSFMKDKILLAATQFATTLVSVPSTSPACYRAMCAACAYYGAQHMLTVTQRSLCIGFLEMQLNTMATGASITGTAAAADSDANAVLPLLMKLKGGVYRAARNGPWVAHNDVGSLQWVVTRALTDVEEACLDGVPIAVTAGELFSANESGLMGASQRLVPTIAQAPQAETARQAAMLIAHGVTELATVSPAFCHDVLERLKRLIAAADAARSNAAAAAAAAATSPARLTDIAVARAWNVLVVMHAMVFRALTAPSVVAALWGTEYRPYTQAWEGAVQCWCAAAPSFDFVVLGSRVLAAVWALGRAVDAGTTRTIVAQQSTSNGVAANMAVTATAAATLPVAHAHAMYHQLNGGAAAMTLPMAVNFLSEQLRRGGLLGDPCTSAALSILLSCITLAEAYPVEAGPALAGSLTAALLSPQPPAMDPLVQSLSLVLLSLLRNVPEGCMNLSQLPNAQHGTDALRDALLRRVVAASRPACQSREEAADVQLVGVLLPQEGAGVLGVDTIMRLLRTRLRQAVATTDPVRRLALHRRSTLHPLVALAPTTVPDVCAAALARAWQRVMLSLPNTEEISVVELVRLSDSASTAATRRAWSALGLTLVERAARSGDDGSSPMGGVTGVVCCLRAVLLSHAPDLGRNALEGGEEAAASAAADTSATGGEELDEEGGQETMLGSTAADSHLMSSKRRKMARAGMTAAEASMVDCPYSDVAGKVLAYTLLLRAVEVGWPVPAPGDTEGTVAAIAAPLADVSPIAGPVLDLLVVALPLLTGVPEALPKAMEVLVAVLKRLQPHSRASVAGWRIQMASALKAVVELALFHPAQVCDVVDAFLSSPFADDGGVKRVGSALVTLLATMNHLGGGDGTSAASRVSLALCELLAFAARPPTHSVSDSEKSPAGQPRWPAAFAVAAEGVRSADGQAALATLCAQVVATVAVAAGFEPPAEWADTPRGHWEKRAAYARCRNGGDAEMGGVPAAAGILDAVGCAWSGDGSNCGHNNVTPTIGPSLRHAVGCLACLVAAANGADARPLATVSFLLSSSHQSLLVRLAYRSLMDSGPEPLTTQTESNLLAVLARTPAAQTAVTATMAEEMVALLLARDTALPVASVGHLLCVVLRSGGAASESSFPLLAQLFALLPVEYVCAAPPSLLVAAAERLGYLPPLCGAAPPRTSASLPPLLLTVDVVAALTPSALVLCERAWLFAVAVLSPFRGRLSGTTGNPEDAAALRTQGEALDALLHQPSPLRRTHLSGQLATLTLAAFDACDSPTVLAACLARGSSCSTRATPADGSGPLAPVLVPLRLATILAGSSDPAVLGRYRGLVCQLLVQSMTSRSNESPSPSSETQVALTVRLLLELLCLQGEEAAAREMMLRPAGAFLIQVVAKRDPQAIRGVIQSLPVERVTVLRRFMEDSATTAPARAAWSN